MELRARETCRLLATGLCWIVATGATAQDEVTTQEALFAMEEVVVTGTASPRRTKYEASVGISTFDDADIDRQAPASTADLLSAVPGFWVESTAGTTQGNVFARGIIQDGGYRYVGLMEDGIPIYPVFELSFYNPDQFVRVDTTVERVEAVRGGTAPIFTSGAVGGTVNFVTRGPTDAMEASFKGTVADYGMRGVDGYWSGPLSPGWGFMMGGYYRVSDGVRDPGYDADEGGQLRAKLVRAFDRGDLEIFAKYIDDRSLFVVPVPLRGAPGDPQGANGADPGTYSLHSADLAAAALPPSAAEVGLQDSSLEDGIHPQLFTAGTRLTLDVTDTMRVTNAFRLTDGEVRFDGIFPGAAPVTGNAFAATAGVAPAFTVRSSGAAFNASELVQNHGHWVVDKQYEALQNDLRVNFLLDEHDLTLGFYYADYSMADRWSLGNQLLMDVSDRPRRLLLAGVTDASSYTRYSTFNLASDYDAEAYAFYVSDEWQATGRLRIDVGVRLDDEEITGSISTGVPDVDLDGDPATPYDVASLAGAGRRSGTVDFDHTGYSIGFNFDLADSHALFGHYTDSAKLPHFDDVRNDVRTADEVSNIELGYKTSQDRAALFVTLFQTEFDNVPFNDILADGSTVNRRAQTRTRGVEIEGLYEPTDELTLSFSVTQQDPEYRAFTGASVDNTGNRIRRIPESMIRLTPTYYFADFRGTVYMTYSRIGTRFANDENTIVLPSYDNIDAGVTYDLSDALTVQAAIDNLTDEVGLTEGNPRTDLGAGGIGLLYNARPLFGRSYRAAVTYRF